MYEPYTMRCITMKQAGRKNDEKKEKKMKKGDEKQIRDSIAMLCIME